MVHREASEAALELVAVDDRAELVARSRLVGRALLDGWHPPGCLAVLGVAGSHQQRVRPGVIAIGVPQPGQVAPDVDHGLLHRVLGESCVTQEPDGQPAAAVERDVDDALERVSVAVLRSDDKSAVHTFPRAMGSAICAAS